MTPGPGGSGLLRTSPAEAGPSSDASPAGTGPGRGASKGIPGHVVKLRIRGRRVAADARNCFDATCDREENFRLARRYWENRPNPQNQPPVVEYLADGETEVLEIVKEIGKNI